jgi:hypothetical protein
MNIIKTNQISRLKTKFGFNNKTSKQLDVNRMNMFCFTLRDAILEWGKKIMHFHPGCIFLELETTFYKRYCIIQNDEQVYMALRVI